ncbi:MAG: TetR/AcrR family transcriptional regulator [Oscillospiraceae bacterium]|nr:TetR/AcrR family transcriptional regulator [Oscillospiraceae bacterium]
MKKQPEVTEATREAFVNAFFQLAKRESIYKITIQEITDLAGYNRTTFYRYFQDVFALMEYAEDQLLQGIREALEPQHGEGQVGQRQFFEIVIRCFHENKERASILLSEQNRSHFLRRIRENVTHNVSRLGNDTPKKQVVRDIYFYGIFYALSINLQSRDALSDEDLLDMIQRLFESWYWPEMTENAGDPAPGPQ